MSLRAKKFSDLPEWLQEKINNRYEQYGISGEEGYNNHFPEEAKKLPADEMEEWFDSKDISHIDPQSTHPEKANDIDNMMLEDSSTNRARGAETMSNEEIHNAESDNIQDAEELKEELSTLEALTDTEGIEYIVGGTSAGILFFSGKEVYDSLQKNEIQLNEIPLEMVKTTAKKSTGPIILGTCLVTGSPIVVAAAVGYLVVKNKTLISKAFSVTWNIISHETTKKVASSLAKGVTIVTISSAMIAGEVISKTTKGVIKIATHETTKKVAAATLKGAATTVVTSAVVGGQIVKGTVKGVVKVANHKTTKKIAKATAKGTITTIATSAVIGGEIIKGTVKGAFKFGKWLFKGKK